MLKTQNIKCKVYLEGVLVRFNRIEIREQVGAPPQCTIGFPANDRAIFTYPKTVCHVFYRHTDDKYYLIFEGQLIGYGIQRNFDRRELQFTFAGLLYNWSATAAANQDLSLMSYINGYALSIGGVAENKLKEINEKLSVKKYLEPKIKNLESLQYALNQKATEEKNLPSDATTEVKQKIAEEIRNAAEVFDKERQKLIDELTSEIKTLESKIANEPDKAQKTVLTQSLAVQKELLDKITNITSNPQVDLKNIGGITGPNIFGAALLTKVAYALSIGKNYTLGQVIDLILRQSGNSLSSYYNSTNYAFRMEERLRIISSEDITKLLSNTSVYMYLSAAVGQEENSTTPKSLLEIFETLLRTIAYNIFEVAAPSWAKHPDKGSNSPTSLFMSPPGDYLSPLSCNFIFNDDIQSLSFSRNVDEEPTRAMSLAKPFATSGFRNDGGLGKVLLATIVPQGRVGAEAGQVVISQTKEEKIRGINLAYREETLMSSLYMLEYLKNNKNIKAPTIKNGEIAMELPKDPDPPEKIASDMNKDKLIRPYHTNVANAEFYLQRGMTRNMNVTTTYSPYRVCGFTGVIFDEHLPYILGKITSIFTSISADGQATQNISFTNVRFHPQEPTTGSERLDSPEAKMDDLIFDGEHVLPGDLSSGTGTDIQDVIDFVPYWYRAFNKYAVHDNFYKYLTGGEKDDRKDLIGVALKEGLKKEDSNKLFNCLKHIDMKYHALLGDAKNTFIEKITKRNLVTEKQYWDFMQKGINPVTPGPNLAVLTEDTEALATGKLFYKFRQNRIKSYFENDEK